MCVCVCVCVCVYTYIYINPNHKPASLGGGRRRDADISMYRTSIFHTSFPLGLTRTLSLTPILFLGGGRQLPNADLPRRGGDGGFSNCGDFRPGHRAQASRKACALALGRRTRFRPARGGIYR